jgi:hypothetical protein
MSDASDDSVGSRCSVGAVKMAGCVGAENTRRGTVAPMGGAPVPSTTGGRFGGLVARITPNLAALYTAPPTDGAGLHRTLALQGVGGVDPQPVGA